jgi:glucose-1-phosphate adenylyltransferase
MDYRTLLSCHQEHHADATVAAFAIPRQQARQFGIVAADLGGNAPTFQEKPTDSPILMSGPPVLLASMGIYVLTFEVQREVLVDDARKSSTHDFGRDILPGLLGRYRTVRGV